MALPSVTIGGNTQYMNAGIQPGMISGGSIVMQGMPQTTYAAPTTTYAEMPQTTYAAAPTTMTYAAPAMGSSVIMQAPTTTYAAPAQTTYAAPMQTYAAPMQTYAAPMQTYAAPTQTYAAPTQTYATSTVMPATMMQMQQPYLTAPTLEFQPLQPPAMEAPRVKEAKRDVKVATKKKAGSCACCAPKKKTTKK